MQSSIISLTKIENLLEVYTLEEILAENDLTEADALMYLVEQQFVELPTPEPL